MALLNNIWVFVENEDLTHDVELSSHKVETGIDLTDHVRRKPVTLSISGKIVNHGNVKASEALTKLRELQKSGSLITYVGRNTVSSLQISSFSTSYPYTNWGGCDFSMSLQEVRIAKAAYTAPKSTTNVSNAGTQQVSKGENTNVYHIVKKGDCIWNLVSKQYKSLKPTYKKTMDKCNWVMSQNQSAFSRKGDFRTLQIGKKILIGYR